MTFVIVVSAPDPVASAVRDCWGPLPASGDHVDGAAIRRLSASAVVLPRAALHIHDERVDLRLPPSLRNARPTLVFPSIHRSAQNIACLTVHPLGNLGPRAEAGGSPRTVCPTDPGAMAALLSRLKEGAVPLGLPVTYEATHHGPALELPSLFVEIGFGTAAGPPPEAVRLLSEALREILPDARDRPVLGVGGGHYAPHFTELALRRCWAFGHLISRHALETLDATTARAAYAASGPADGVLFARAQDASTAALAGLGERRRDGEAPVR